MMTFIVRLVIGMSFSLYFFYSPSALAQGSSYDGSFSEINATTSDCDSIFAVTDYKAQHYLSGASGRTSVLNFRNADGQGFFNRLTFVSLYGPNGDILSDRDVLQGNVRYRIHLEGLVNYDFVIADVTVRKIVNGEMICSASAGYSAFN